MSPDARLSPVFLWTYKGQSWRLVLCWSDVALDGDTASGAVTEK